MARLGLAIPLSLALIVLLRLVNFSNLTDTLLTASVLPDGDPALAPAE